MENDHHMFYALNINGETAYICETSKGAMEMLSIRFNEDSSKAYEIEPIKGIWNMLLRLSNFEDRDDDDWMEDVLKLASEMVFGKHDGGDIKRFEKHPEDKNSQK